MRTNPVHREDKNSMIFLGECCNHLDDYWFVDELRLSGQAGIQNGRTEAPESSDLYTCNPTAARHSLKRLWMNSQEGRCFCAV